MTHGSLHATVFDTAALTVRDRVQRREMRSAKARRFAQHRLDGRRVGLGERRRQLSQTIDPPGGLDLREGGRDVGDGGHGGLGRLRERIVREAAAVGHQLLQQRRRLPIMAVRGMIVADAIEDLRQAA